MLNEILSFGNMNHKQLLPHKNRGMEIVYVSKGCLQWQVDGHCEKLYPDSVFFTLPWQSHGSLYKRDPANMIYWILFKLDCFYTSARESFGFYKKLGFSHQQQQRISRIFCQTQNHTWQASDQLKWLMPALVQELKTPGQFTQTYARSLLKAVIIELARIICKSSNCPDNTSSSDSYRFIESFIEKLTCNCAEQWSLNSMANACHLQRTQFSELIKKFTGESPMNLLNRIRIKKARELLMTTDMSITEIAFQCGYNSSQYFAKVFHHLVDMSPRNFRSITKNNPAKDQSPEQAQSAWTWRSETEEKERMKQL